MNHLNGHLFLATERKKNVNGAFTLIELLTVMAIIVVLAGLVVGAAGIIQNKAARSRAQSEIAAISTAITSYETDNGSVPRTTETNTPNARVDDNPGDPNPSSTMPTVYSASSVVLYKLLSGNFYINQSSTSTVTVLTQWRSATINPDHPDRPKTYYEFKPNQLSVPAASVVNGAITDPTTVVCFIDPFGLSYGYSTAYQAALDLNPNVTPTKGFNPTYDLWSTASYGFGKPYPTTVTAADKPNLWIKNWN